MNVKLEGIYVELDALLDTRIATVARLHGDEVAFKVLTNGYHQRTDDKFAGVDFNAYKRLYAERDTKTLQNAALTEIVGVLRTIIGELSKQAISRPYHNGTRIVVNTYPYVLAEEELAVMEFAIPKWIGDFSDAGVILKTEFIRMSKAELTPTYCKENLTAMFMYEYEDWFTLQQRAFMKLPIPQVTLYAPAIYHVATPTSQEIEELKREMAHPFAVMEATAKPFICLDLLDVSDFSIVRPAAEASQQQQPITNPTN